MSKSRGTFITARAYLDHLDPEYLRYLLRGAARPGLDDIDLSLEDFVNRVNADLVGKLVNIASRCAGFLHGGSAAGWPPRCRSPASTASSSSRRRIGDDFGTREYARAVRRIMALADGANK